MVTALTYLTPPNEDENYINSDELVFFFLHLHNHFFFFPPIHMHIKHFFSKDRPASQVLGSFSSEAWYYHIDFETLQFSRLQWYFSSVYTVFATRTLYLTSETILFVSQN